MPATQKEFLERPACPLCGGADLSAGPSSFEGTSATQEVDCENCGGSYVEVMELVGYMLRCECGDLHQPDDVDDRRCRRCRDRRDDQ